MTSIKTMETYIGKFFMVILSQNCSNNSFLLALMSHLMLHLDKRFIK